jgi:SAM-dependent methyltransferase
MSPLIFDRDLLVRRRDRWAAAAPAHDFLLHRTAEDLADRLSLIRRTFPVAVCVGAFHGVVSRRLRQLAMLGLVIDMEASPRLAARCDGPVVVADEEILPFRTQSLDLVISGLALQHANDVPGILAQIRRALKPDGLLLASVLGGLTLHELRQAFVAAESETAGGASPRVAPFADVRDFGGLLQRAGFALPVADADIVEVAYPDALALMHDVQAMGMSNALHERRRAFLRRDTLFRAAEIYAERFARPDGRVIATFEIITLTGWAPHPEQQQPLKPGSAEVRLAEILGDPDRPAGRRGGEE